MNSVSLVAATMFFAFTSTSCSHSSGHAKAIPFACSQPAPYAGKEIFFKAKVLALKEKSLHMDFDGFGVDFSSVEIRFDDPSQWSGIRASIYYRDEPVLNGVRLSSGTTFEFKLTPPSCLDQPWLFLSDLSKRP